MRMPVPDSLSGEKQRRRHRKTGRDRHGYQQHQCRGTGKEWAYVPEIISVEDDRASYEDMQLIGDTVCYISMAGEAEGENQEICSFVFN